MFTFNRLRTLLFEKQILETLWWTTFHTFLDRWTGFESLKQDTKLIIELKKKGEKGEVEPFLMPSHLRFCCTSYIMLVSSHLRDERTLGLASSWPNFSMLDSDKWTFVQLISFSFLNFLNRFYIILQQLSSHKHLQSSQKQHWGFLKGI